MPNLKFALRTLFKTPFVTIVNDVEAPLQKGMSPQTLARFKAKPILLDAGSRGQSSVSREAKAPLARARWRSG